MYRLCLWLSLRIEASGCDGCAQLVEITVNRRTSTALRNVKRDSKYIESVVLWAFERGRRPTCGGITKSVGLREMVTTTQRRPLALITVGHLSPPSLPPVYTIEVQH